jgi:hypothetical protein
VKLSRISPACALLALLSTAAVAGCTYRSSRGHWRLEQGAIVNTSFSLDITQVDIGPEDSTRYEKTVSCVPTSEQPDVVRVTGVAGGWVVWGAGVGSAVLRLDCGSGDTGYIDVDVVAP